jgi:hypothetical protein
MKQRTLTAASFTALPAWTMPSHKDKGLYALAAALTLANMENRWVKLSADTQRAVIGCNRFGKQSIGLFDGQLMITRSVAYGTDRDTRYVNVTGLQP